MHMKVCLLTGICPNANGSMPEYIRESDCIWVSECMWEYV